MPIKQNGFGCPYLERVRVRTGRHPINKYYCDHPTKLIIPFSKKTSYTRGEYIGEEDLKPSWCPLISN